VTLKLEGDLDVLKMYFHIENEVARLRHLKLLIMDEIYIWYYKCNEKKYEMKSQGQMSPTSNHFWRSPCDVFLPSYLSFRPVVFDIFYGQADAQTDSLTDATKRTPACSIAGVQVMQRRRNVLKSDNGLYSVSRRHCLVT